MHLLAKLMVSSEEVAASLISRQPSGEGAPAAGCVGTGCLHAWALPQKGTAPRLWNLCRGAPPCLALTAQLANPSPCPAPPTACAAPMTGLLSRMNSLGPTGKAAHKLAQHLTRALSASRPTSPTAAAAGGAGSGQFARFNSLLSAASGASSAAGSPRAGSAAAPAPFGRGPVRSRFGSQAALSRQPSGAGLPSAAGSPTAAATAAATAGGGLSRQGSLASVLQAAAVEQADGAATGELDAAAWARHFQQSQQASRGGGEGRQAGTGATHLVWQCGSAAAGPAGQVCICSSGSVCDS